LDILTKINLLTRNSNPGNNTHNIDIPNECETNLNINNSSEIGPVEVCHSNSNEI